MNPLQRLKQRRDLVAQDYELGETPGEGYPMHVELPSGQYMDPHAGETIGPLPEGDTFNPPSERFNRYLSNQLPGAGRMIDWLRDKLGFGPGELIMDPVDILYKGVDRGRQAAVQQSIDPLTKWVGEELPEDLVWYSSGPVAGSLAKRAAKLPMGQARSALTSRANELGAAEMEAKKRLGSAAASTKRRIGKVIDTIVETFGD